MWLLLNEDLIKLLKDDVQSHRDFTQYMLMLVKVKAISRDRIIFVRINDEYWFYKINT